MYYNLEYFNMQKTKIFSTTVILIPLQTTFSLSLKFVLQSSFAGTHSEETLLPYITVVWHLVLSLLVSTMQSKSVKQANVLCSVQYPRLSFSPMRPRPTHIGMDWRQSCSRRHLYSSFTDKDNEMRQKHKSTVTNCFILSPLD